MMTAAEILGCSVDSDTVRVATGALRKQPLRPVLFNRVVAMDKIFGAD